MQTSYPESKIIFGPNAQPEFDFLLAQDNQDFKVGAITLRLLHTPGHTMESSSMLLIDSASQQKAVFTGDALFLGEVGRPDLAVKGESITITDLASHLFESLKRLKALPGTTMVFPGHGQGSACGKFIQSGNFSTIEDQIKTNIPFSQEDKAQFIEMATSNLPKPPSYFFNSVAENKKISPQSGESIMKEQVNQLSISEIREIIASEEYQLIDSRSTASAYQTGLIRHSVLIPLDSDFAIKGSTLLDVTKRTIVVATSEQEAQEAILRLTRVGFTSFYGFGLTTELLEGADKLEMVAVETVQPADAVKLVKNLGPNQVVLDVRNPGEWEAGCVRKDSQLLKLDHIPSNLD